MDRERFEKQIAFIMEADKEKNILRQTHLSGHGRQENDAEHAWHMAMMMAIIHDIVEIDAGDTYAYDEAGLATQQERERLAADRIFGLLPDDQRDELRALFEEFEALQSPEARFAKTMDNFQPLLLNDVNDGGDWRTHKVCRTQIMKRHQKTRLGSNEIADYAEMLIDVNVDKGNIRNE